MNNYERYKLSQQFDEDCELMTQENDLELAYKKSNDSLAFKQKYKEFYTDIKLSHKEDW